LFLHTVAATTVYQLNAKYGTKEQICPEIEAKTSTFGSAAVSFNLFPAPSDL